MSKKNFIPFKPVIIEETESIYKSEIFYKWMDKRRTIREFSPKTIVKEIIQNIIRSASTAPSGAHKQPWTFCAISNPKLKAGIRKAAEEEEYENYDSRMSEEWLDNLAQFETNWEKPFLEIAPWLIVVFSKSYDLDDKGQKLTNYYVKESVGLACGMLLTAIQNAGLCAPDPYSKSDEFFN